MKAYRLLLVALFPMAFLVGACGHTNQLAQYNVVGKTALFRSFSASDAASGISVVESPSKNTAVEIIAAIGSAIVSDQSRRKLERAFNGDSVAHGISQGIRNATADYLSVRPVQSMADDPDLIIETELTDCKLVSSSLGIAMQVRGKSRVIDRRSGTIVWDDAESHTIPLSETYLAAIAPKAVSSGVSIFNAVQLLNLEEEELRLVVTTAAVDAGREIGETLREDVADLNKK
jgi:hypothetical protein